MDRLHPCFFSTRLEGESALAFAKHVAKHRGAGAQSSPAASPLPPPGTQVSGHILPRRPQSAAPSPGGGDEVGDRRWEEEDGLQ